MLNIKNYPIIIGILLVIYAISFGIRLLNQQLLNGYEETNNLYYLIASFIVVAIIIKFNLFW
jgi:hypothetical protein